MKQRDPVGDPRASSLERGRADYARRAWGEAHEALAAADAAAPLAVDDLEQLAWSAGLSGQDDAYLRAMERVYDGRLARGDQLLAARVAFAMGMRLFALGEPGRAGGWLERAQRLVDGKDCAERGYLLFPVIRRHERGGEHATAAALAAEAAQIGDRFGEPDLAVLARCIQGQILLAQGQLDAGLALLDEAMVSVTSNRLSPMFTGLAYCTVIAGCRRIYALDRSREWTAALTRWCEEQPQLVAFTGECLVHRAELLLLGGDWPEAIGEARRAADRGTRGAAAQTAGDAVYQEAEIHRLRGELDEAERAYRTASELGREAQPGLALLRLRQGRAEAAANAIRPALGAMTDPLARARFLPATVEIMLAVGASAEATAACCELEEIAARFRTDVLGAMAGHARGAVELADGRAQTALEPLRRALAVWQQLGAPYLAARLRLTVARACQALGDDDSAKLERELARQALDRLGVAPDDADVEPPEPPAAAGAPAGITARELQVLRLVATGKTNKVIAKELFLSEKTIDRHVSNIFNKLNVASRAAATAYAYEHHLI